MQDEDPDVVHTALLFVRGLVSRASGPPIDEAISAGLVPVLVQLMNHPVSQERAGFNDDFDGALFDLSHAAV